MRSLTLSSMLYKRKGVNMQLMIDRVKLDALMKRGGYRNYRHLAHAAKARGLPLAEGTIYKMVEEATWTATRLAALCELLNCTPADLIPNWNGEQRHTHVSPQPAKELEVQPA